MERIVSQSSVSNQLQFLSLSLSSILSLPKICSLTDLDMQKPRDVFVTITTQLFPLSFILSLSLPHLHPLSPSSSSFLSLIFILSLPHLHPLTSSSSSSHPSSSSSSHFLVHPTHHPLCLHNRLSHLVFERDFFSITLTHRL